MIYAFAFSERHKAASALNKRQDLLQALIKLHSPARSSWFPLRGRGARVDPESLKAGNEEIVIKFVDREGARREVAVQVTSGDASLVKRVKEMGERALKELGVVSCKRFVTVLIPSDGLSSAFCTAHRPLHTPAPFSSAHRRPCHRLSSLRRLFSGSDAAWGATSISRYGGQSGTQQAAVWGVDLAG